MTLDAAVLDNLTPTQDLIIEVLVARHRLGESSWSFSTKLGKTISELVDLKLVSSQSGNSAGMLRVSLTWPAQHILELSSGSSAVVDTEPAKHEYIPPSNRAYADRIAAYLKRVGAETMAHQAVGRLFGTDAKS